VIRDRTRNLFRESAPRHHLHRRPAVHVGLVEYDIRPHVCWPGGQHLLLAVNQIGDVEGRQLKPMPVRDRVSRASFHAIPAEDTSIVIYVVDPGVTLGAADPVLGGVIGGFNVDAVGWARRGAKEAGHTLLQPILVALKHVGAAKAGFDASPAKRPLAVGIVLDGGGLEHLHKGDAHPLGNGRDVLKNRHAQLVYRRSGEQCGASRTTRGSGEVKEFPSVWSSNVAPYLDLHWLDFSSFFPTNPAQY
jgi:hypothetical protein